MRSVTLTWLVTVAPILTAVITMDKHMRESLWEPELRT